AAADGAALTAGQRLGMVHGPLRSVLTGERSALNFLSHLSGIATLTRAHVDACGSHGRSRIRDTRKTTPGLRALEKAAVRAAAGADSVSCGALTQSPPVLDIALDLE